MTRASGVVASWRSGMPGLCDSATRSNTCPIRTLDPVFAFRVGRPATGTVDRLSQSIKMSQCDSTSIASRNRRKSATGNCRLKCHVLFLAGHVLLRRVSTRRRPPAPEIRLWSPTPAGQWRASRGWLDLARTAMRFLSRPPPAQVRSWSYRVKVARHATDAQKPSSSAVPSASRQATNFLCTLV